MVIDHGARIGVLYIFSSAGSRIVTWIHIYICICICFCICIFILYLYLQIRRSAVMFLSPGGSHREIQVVLRLAERSVGAGFPASATSSSPGQLPVRRTPTSGLPTKSQAPKKRRPWKGQRSVTHCLSETYRFRDLTSELERFKILQNLSLIILLLFATLKKVQPWQVEIKLGCFWWEFRLCHSAPLWSSFILQFYFGWVLKPGS